MGRKVLLMKMIDCCRNYWKQAVLLVSLVVLLCQIAVHNGWGSYSESLLAVVMLILGSGLVSKHLNKHDIKRDYKKPFHIIEDYIKCYNDDGVKSVPAAEVQGKIEIKHTPSGNGFIMKISDVEKYIPQDFFMALIEYVPCEHWDNFHKRDFELVFDVKGTGITAVQLEIKNSNKSKIIDKKISVNANFERQRIKLNKYVRYSKAWEDVKEICFTVFTRNEYMENIMNGGQLIIDNLSLDRSEDRTF